MKNYRKLSRIFSSSDIERLANGDIEHVADVAHAYIDSLPESFTPADVYETCYRDISKNYRFEYFFKNVVANKILLGRHRMSNATLVSEFRVGNNKADCVVLNGSSVCYEIKTDLDNFSRLNDQLQACERVFDKTYVVVSENHRKYALSNVNEDVGVIVLTARNTLSEVRGAKLVCEDVDASMLIRSLRQPEYISMACQIEAMPCGISNTEIFSWCESVFIKAGSNLLRSAFCRTLKSTRGANKDFSLSLPRSLLMASLSINLSESKKANLTRVLNSPV